MPTSTSFFVREESKVDSVQPTIEVEEYFDDSLRIHAYYDKNDEYNYVVVNLTYEDLCKLADFLNQQIELTLEK